MLLLPPSPPAQWRLRAVSASRTHSQARELRAGACVGSSRVGHVPRQHVGAGHCRVGFSRVRHVSVMSSERLARAGRRGRVTVLEATISRGKRPGRSLVSMVLTSTLHRRYTPKKNRRIPTISAGCFGGWIVDVSAVDTGPRRSESGVLGDTARRRCGVEPPPQLSPTLRRLPYPAPATRVPSRVTNVMTSNIELYPVPARRPAGHGSTPAPPRSYLESVYSTRVGIY